LFKKKATAIKNVPISHKRYNTHSAMLSWEVDFNLLKCGRVRLRTGVRYSTSTEQEWYGEKCIGCAEPLTDIVNLGYLWEAKGDILYQKQGYFCIFCEDKSMAWATLLFDNGLIARNTEEWNEWISTTNGRKLNDDVFILSESPWTGDLEWTGYYSEWYKRYAEVAGQGGATKYTDIRMARQKRYQAVLQFHSEQKNSRGMDEDVNTAMQGVEASEEDVHNLPVTHDEGITTDTHTISQHHIITV
jgi:hypothetical protein